MKKNINLILIACIILVLIIGIVFVLLLTGKIEGPIKIGSSESTTVVGDALGDISNEGDSEEINVPKEFRITNHAGTQITVTEGKVYFKGTSDPAEELTCNGEKIETASTGEFSIDRRVTPGPNEFIFQHKGESYKYTVNYTVDVLRSVSPEEEISVPAGMEIELSAIALRDSEITVDFNGKSYSMKIESDVRRNDEESEGSNEELAVYTVTVEAPDHACEIGQISVTGKCKGVTETMKGGNIKVTVLNKIPKPVIQETESVVTEKSTVLKTTTQKTTTEPQQTEVPSTKGKKIKSNLSHKYTNAPKTTQAAVEPEQAEFNGEEENETPVVIDRLQKYSYSKNYGLGSATVCQITDDYVEIYPSKNTKTYALPNYTPLLKSTFDYVESEIDIDGDKYYLISSGYKVPKNRKERVSSGNMGTINHVSIKEGYITPANTIKVVSCGNEDGKTVIKLDMNKSVPFVASLTGQSYKDYNGRPVAVSSCTCTGIKFTFSQTASAVGNLSFGNSVISGGRFSTNSDDVETTLTLDFSKSGKFYGYHCEYDDGYLIISFNNKPSSLSGYTIMLDPGHGGIDSGASCCVSSSGMSLEKYINLSIATKVGELLQAEGATVVMTRSNDSWVCYTDRNNAVRNRNPDMFISIHCDGSESASAYGTSAYYYRAYSQPLAKAVHESIVSAYKNTVYAEKTSEFRSKVSRGADYYAFRVLRVEECPAILIEYGFVTNTLECQKLQNSTVRDVLARATVNGIKNYIASN